MRALRHPDFESPTRGNNELSIAAVAAAEEALGVTLPDDVLALMACDVPAISGACGLQLDEATNWNRAVHDVQYAPDDLVGLGYLCDTLDEKALWTSSPEGEGVADWSTYHSYVVCIPRDAACPGLTEILLYPQFANRRSAERRLLRELVAANLLARYGKLTDAGYTYEPKLGGASEPTPPPVRRVRHPKFGVGTIVAEHGDQLTIDFERVGTKRVKASFVVSI